MRPFVIITVESDEMDGVHDVEVPSGVSVGQLKRDITEVLNAYKGYTLDTKSLYCQRLGRVLDDSKTFSELGIRNGDVIKLEGYR